MSLILEDRIVNSKKKLMICLVLWNVTTQKTKLFTEELFAITKVRHLNFFASIIQANVRKEAEDIPLAAFEFWTDKKAKILFEEEINKFRWSDLSSDIDGYEYGMILLMITMIKVKKHIGQLPGRIKKEALRDTKLKDFVKLPIEKQRQ